MYNHHNFYLIGFEMLFFAVLCIAVSVGFIYGTAHGVLAFGVCIFTILVLRAVFARIPRVPQK